MTATNLLIHMAIIRRLRERSRSILSQLTMSGYNGSNKAPQRVMA